MRFCFRCNFALMMLAEIVSDRRDISWIHYLPLLLHVSFLGKRVYIHAGQSYLRLIIIYYYLLINYNFSLCLTTCKKGIVKII